MCVPIFLQIRCSVGATIWCRDVGSYSPHGMVPGGFPGLDGAATDGLDPAAASRREMGVHLSIVGEGRGRV